MLALTHSSLQSLAKQPSCCPHAPLAAPVLCRPHQSACNLSRRPRKGVQRRDSPVAPVAAQGMDTNEAEEEEERVLRTLQQCTRRIRELGDRGRVKDAIQELANLSKKNVQPDTYAATALVRACCKDMELAQSVFDELFGDFLEPDEVAFAVLLRGYGNANPPNWQKIDATLTTMQLKYGLVPATTSYNALLEVCCRTNDVERGEDIIDRMHTDEVEPDEFTEAAVASKRTLRAYLRKVFS